MTTDAAGAVATLVNANSPELALFYDGVRQQPGVDYSLTVSCYQVTDDGRACGRCDSCRLRRQGFADAGVEDPTVYQQAPAGS